MQMCKGAMMKVDDSRVSECKSNGALYSRSDFEK